MKDSKSGQSRRWAWSGEMFRPEVRSHYFDIKSLCRLIIYVDTRKTDVYACIYTYLIYTFQN